MLSALRPLPREFPRLGPRDFVGVTRLRPDLYAIIRAAVE